MEILEVKVNELPTTCVQCKCRAFDPNAEPSDEFMKEKGGTNVCVFTGEEIWNTQRGEKCPLTEEVPIPIENFRAKGQWEVIHGVMTPGGDPLVKCPFCKSEDSVHLIGIEMPKHWNYCPVCGAELQE